MPAAFNGITRPFSRFILRRASSPTVPGKPKTRHGSYSSPIQRAEFDVEHLLHRPSSSAKVEGRRSPVLTVPCRHRAGIVRRPVHPFSRPTMERD